MNISRRNSLLGSLFLLLLSFAAGPAGACVWPYQEPAYWREFLAGEERDALLGGKVGIVDSNWKDPGLFVAWRHLEGLGVPEKFWPAFWLDDYDHDRETVDSSEPPPAEGEGVPVDLWRAALVKLTGEENMPWPTAEFYGDVPDGKGGTRWSAFLNCLDPAFKTATAALAERVERWGADSRELKEWLRGQRQVFANCGEIGEAPPELDASWPEELRADRQYQIAAADFYAQRYEAAAARFRRIAADKKSPWAATAAFAVARCTLRRELYAQAADEFRAMLKSNDLLEFHDAAERLAKFAELRADPLAAAKKIEAEMRAKELPTFPVDRLYDVRWLAKKLDPSPELPLIYFFQSISNWRLPATDAYAHWQKVKTPTSLLVALARATEALAGNDAATLTEGAPQLGAAERETLVAAAVKIGKSSPAYLSVRYYRAALLAALDKNDEARQELDRLLQEKIGDQGDVQRLRHLRAHLAKNWSELVDFGLMVPLGETDEEHSEVFYEIDIAGYNNELADDERLLIPVAVESINRFASLAELAELQKIEKLPKHYRRDLALVGFLRAAYSGDIAKADDFAEAAEAMEPELGELFADWRQNDGADNKKFEVALLNLRQPGLSIDLWPTWGRNTARSEIDEVRQNWWCAVTELPTHDKRPAFLRGHEAPPETGLGWGSGPNYLGRLVLDYAKANPDDPRLPEALARVVKATRFGCFGESFAEVSKGAFTLLHKRFPKSEWAKQTPYWFE